MARLYTTEEAYRKLGISQATFYRWVTKAKAEGFGDQIEAQPSSDGRESLYQLSQLRWLAKEHGKELLSDEEVADKQSEVDALRRDLDHLGQLLLEEQATSRQLREQIQRLEQEIRDMDAKVKEAYSFCVQQIGQLHTDLVRMNAQKGSASRVSWQWSPTPATVAPTPPPQTPLVGERVPPVDRATSPMSDDVPPG
jgi:hypothetical protein